MAVASTPQHKRPLSYIISQTKGEKENHHVAFVLFVAPEERWLVARA